MPPSWSLLEGDSPVVGMTTVGPTCLEPKQWSFHLLGIRRQPVATGRSFCDSVPVSVNVGGNGVERAVFRLGPMDGREHPIESDTGELSVAMTDGQQHLYVRTDEVQHLPNGQLGVVFVWTGRYYGPK